MVSERKPGMVVNAPPGSKRLKGEGMPPEAMHGHGPMPPHRYPQQAYPGYPMGWQGQYGGPPPPHGWQGGQPPPPGMYPQRGGPPMTPERGYGYPRGPHPHQPPPNSGAPGPTSTPRRNMKPNGKSQKTGGDNPMPPQYGYGGNHQWGPQYGGPPPPGQWGAHPPPPPPHMQQQPPYQNAWPGAAQTPPRRPRSSPETMMAARAGYPPSAGSVCPPVGMDGAPPPGPDGDMYVTSRGVGMHDDDGQSSQGGKHSDKDKGRGSYKCGRCGVPKKGHVCPYQPKVKRRSGEPAPEMKSAAVQVEMDEFMTLRRLNIRIQGYPESYAADPTLANMVVGEPRPSPMSMGPGMSRSMMTGDVPIMSGPDPARSSPHHHPTPIHGSSVPSAALNEPTKS